MKISVSFHGLDTMIARVGGFGKQIDFAASRALNSMAKKVADGMPAQIEKSFDRPTPFTKRGVRVLKYANKANLSATVGFMDAQAKYMGLQIHGGTRPADEKGIRIPGAIKVNEFGNIPRGLIKQLIAVANGEKRIGRVKARRIAVSNKVDLFYGEPEIDGRQLPRGIYKRVGDKGAHKLIPLVVFRSTPASYKQRLKFFEFANDVARREWPELFKKAIDEAMRTAR